VVDDDPHILRVVGHNLAAHGYAIYESMTAGDALAQLDRVHPDLILLDLGLPDVDGAEVIERVRSRSQTPIVVLSARDQEREKVRALDLGADDYLTKPFGLDELLARVRVALRHAAQPAGFAGETFRTGEIEVDLGRRRETSPRRRSAPSADRVRIAQGVHRQSRPGADASLAAAARLGSRVRQ
jgi:two-component system KDP operon response regulator KdpE